MDFNKAIGNKINSLLAEKGICQKDLAKELGVKDNIISYWCNGNRKPNTEQIVQIAKFFNVSSDYLLGLSNVPTTDKDFKYVCDTTGFKMETIKFLNFLTDIENAPEDFKKENYYKDQQRADFYIRIVEKLICSSSFFFDLLEYAQKQYNIMVLVENGSTNLTPDESDFCTNAFEFARALVMGDIIKVLNKYSKTILHETGLFDKLHSEHIEQIVFDFVKLKKENEFMPEGDKNE